MCASLNISPKLLFQQKQIDKHYDEQNKDFYFGLILNPNKEDVLKLKNKYKIETFTYNDYEFGIYLKNNA